MGYTLDGRGYIGTAYCRHHYLLSQGAFTRPQISMYNVLFGPVYRFYLQPKYSVSGRVMGGWAYGNFSGDTNGYTTSEAWLSIPREAPSPPAPAVIGEYNLTPNVGFKLAPEYFATGFGSTVQGSFGFTAGIVYRWGKQ